MPKLSEEEWGLESIEAQRAANYKWGWNVETGASVWEVAGGRDGQPFHQEQLTTAWGRPPSGADGDVLGVAAVWRELKDGSSSYRVSLTVFYGRPIPKDILAWFARAFPSCVVDVVS